MQCPTCQQYTPDAWTAFQTSIAGSFGEFLESAENNYKPVSLDWMYCANPDCRQLVVRFHETVDGPGDDGISARAITTWLSFPRSAQRPLDPLVTGKIRRDYEEAAAILDMSPRMSAVLSRSILADLLEEHAGLEQYSLAERIDKFVADISHPSSLRENLHYLREIADLSAHTKKIDQLEVVEIGHDEAEWTLDVTDRLLDYFVIAPEKDRKLRDAMDTKIAAANRKPIKDRLGAK